MICLYGYSLFCFLPAVTACILPIGFLQWLCMLYGLAIPVSSFVQVWASIRKE
uniref:Uncharacterized protein n=1 Tax=Nymphaea colorata TaxID=210225 RepID=A0A5K1HAM2_9MAGN|nr:unnamed protein product [Nymphaea colorata]